VRKETKQISLNWNRISHHKDNKPKLESDLSSQRQ
jgi:hypothetical protein